jgi:mRNA interferase HigB
MFVLNRERISEFWAKHNQAKSPLEAWFKEASDSNWVTPQDIKDRYPQASFLANNRVIFNIKGNSYRLVVQVRYQHGIVLIEWIGTHAEYDKKKF